MYLDIQLYDKSHVVKSVEGSYYPKLGYCGKEQVYVNLTPYNLESVYFTVAGENMLDGLEMLDYLYRNESYYSNIVATKYVTGTRFVWWKRWTKLDAEFRQCISIIKRDDGSLSGYPNVYQALGLSDNIVVLTNEWAYNLVGFMGQEHKIVVIDDEIYDITVIDKKKYNECRAKYLMMTGNYTVK